MAGRNHMPRHPGDFQDFRGGPRPILNRGTGPLPVHPAALEEEIEIQHREIQRIVAENHHLIDENVILKRDVVAAKDEIHRLGQHLVKLRAEKDSQNRDLIERGLKMEADLRATEPLREEVMHLRDEAPKLNALRQDLTVQIQGLTRDITRLRSENKQLSLLRADVDGIRKELAEARRALEHEKKANEEQMVQKQALEKNLVSMTREMQKLRSEQLSIDRRPHGFGGGGGSSSGYGYGMYSESREMRFPSAAFGDNSYGGAWAAPYDNRGLPRR